MALSLPKGRIGPNDLRPGDVVFPIRADSSPWLVVEREGPMISTFCLWTHELRGLHEAGTGVDRYGGRVMVFRGGEEINMTYDPEGVFK